jgi:hypothetical protein
LWELVFNQALEELFFVTLPIFYVIGMVVAFTGIPLFILFWKRWLPLPARTLFWASRRRTPPLILCHDSGRGEITTIKERKGEGIVITAQGKYKILPRWTPKFSMLRELPKEEEETTGQAEDAKPDSHPETDLNEALDIKVLHKNFLLDYSDWIVKRTNLVGMNLPLWFGYTGKLCLLNPEALALYEAGEMMVKTEDGSLFNPHNIKDKKVKEALQPLLLLDPRKINQIIYNGFDQSQIAGVVADSEELTRLGMGISPKMKALFGIIIIVVLALMAIFFLPQLLGGQSAGKSIPHIVQRFIL